MEEACGGEEKKNLQLARRPELPWFNYLCLVAIPGQSSSGNTGKTKRKERKSARARFFSANGKHIETLLQKKRKRKKFNLFVSHFALGSSLFFYCRRFQSWGFCLFCGECGGSYQITLLRLRQTQDVDPNPSLHLTAAVGTAGCQWAEVSVAPGHMGGLLCPVLPCPTTPLLQERTFFLFVHFSDINILYFHKCAWNWFVPNDQALIFFFGTCCWPWLGWEDNRFD